MKLGFTSDLHIDFNEDFPILETLVSVCVDRKIQALFVAGDISNNGKLSLSFLNQFTHRSGIPAYCIFGNHDYYHIPKDKFYEMREHQNVFPMIFNDTAIIADTGWYDYEWHKTGSIGQLKKGKYMHGGVLYSWPDHRWIKWPEEGGAEWFVRHTMGELERQNTIVDNSNIKNKIIMTHMVPHYELLEQEYDYRLTNVFFGSETLSQWIKNVKPQYSIFGHTHYAKDKIIDGTLYICRPVGYNMEFPYGRPLYEHIDNMLFELDI